MRRGQAAVSGAIPAQTPAVLLLQERSRCSIEGAGVTSEDSGMQWYDPLIAPDPDAWLALDEGERIELVESYHKLARVELPSPEVHAALHTAVETQLAMRLPAVESACNRMLSEGLDRHDAIHAVCLVLMTHFNELAGHRVTDAHPNDAYYRALDQLTAAKWRASGGMSRSERRARLKRHRRPWK
ncbi:MAG TPA: hypothetical protein VFE56_12570 [Candidatus Binataceae bacterium]|nr:hypothetical protein [Candidatus Binataceae bacterium]